MKFHAKLSMLGRAALKDALDRHERGLDPVIALRYALGVTSKSGRKAGVDFVALPGVDPDVHVGALVSIRDDKLRLKDLTRGDGQELGNTYLSVERIIEFVIIASAVEGNPKPSKPRRKRTPTPPVRERSLKDRPASG